MTVKEMIEELSKLDPSMDVVIYITRFHDLVEEDAVIKIDQSWYSSKRVVAITHDQGRR